MCTVCEFSCCHFTIFPLNLHVHLILVEVLEVLEVVQKRLLLVPGILFQLHVKVI